jgi:hypothetical protein
MARQRHDDLDEDFEVSLGFSDMEVEDNQAIDSLTNKLESISIKNDPPPRSIRSYFPNKNKKGKINLKRLLAPKKPLKCQPTSSVQQSLRYLLLQDINQK